MMAAGQRGVSLREISERFGCHERTAQRMVEALLVVFPSAERRTEDDRHVRWVLPSRALAQFLSPSADELVALTAGIDELARSGMTSEAERLRQLEAKVRALIPERTATRLAVDEEALALALGHAVRPGPRFAYDEAVDAAIYQALKGPFRLRFKYRKDSATQPTDRVVEPYGLLLGIRRYLVAKDVAKAAGGLRHFKVEGISDAVVLGETFVLDDGFDIRTHGQRGFGSYEDQREHGDVVWKFAPAAAERAKGFEFHPTQSVEQLEDGSLIVRFSASGHLEMCWHLYMWGAAVEVIEPAALRDMVGAYRRNDFASLP